MARIAVVGSYAPSLINFRGEMLQAFRAAGHDVLACAPEISDDIRSTLRGWGVDVAEVPMQRQGMRPTADLHTAWALYRVFRRWQPARVFSYTAKPVVYGSLAAWAAGARPYAFMTGLGFAYTVDTGKAYWLRRILGLLYRLAYRACDTVIFQNPDDRARMREEGVLGGGQPTAIVNGSGIDTEAFTPVPLPERPVFLCMARLIAEKGIREYVGAARRVKADHPEVAFRLAGRPEPDAPRGVTREEVEAWEQEGVIEYLGYVDDVRAALAETTAYVLPSYREGTPRSVLEAMAMGRPIITSDAPGCRETVENGTNGWLVEPRTTGELEEVMRWMVNHPEEWEPMGHASRERAVTKYDVRRVNESIMEIMDLLPDTRLDEKKKAQIKT